MKSARAQGNSPKSRHMKRTSQCFRHMILVTKEQGLLGLVKFLDFAWGRSLAGGPFPLNVNTKIRVRMKHGAQGGNSAEFCTKTRFPNFENPQIYKQNPSSRKQNLIYLMISECVFAGLWGCGSPKK